MHTESDGLSYLDTKMSEQSTQDARLLDNYREQMGGLGLRRRELFTKLWEICCIEGIVNFKVQKNLISGL